MLSLVTPEKRVPEDHPLRQVKTLAADAVAGIRADVQLGRTALDPAGAAAKSTMLYKTSTTAQLANRLGSREPFDGYYETACAKFPIDTNGSESRRGHL